MSIPDERFIRHTGVIKRLLSATPKGDEALHIRRLRLSGRAKRDVDFALELPISSSEQSGLSRKSTNRNRNDRSAGETLGTSLEPAHRIDRAATPAGIRSAAA